MQTKSVSAITIEFTGFVKYIDIPTALYTATGRRQSLDFSTEELIKGRYTYDLVSGTNVVDAYSNTGRTAYYNALTDWTISIGSYTFSYDGVTHNNIEIFDRSSIGEGDRYLVQSYGASGPTINQMSPEHFSIGLIDHLGNSLSKTDLLMTPPNLDLFPTKNFSVSFRNIIDSTFYESIVGELDSLSIAVYEPEAVNILLIGLLGALFIRTLKARSVS